MMDPRPLLRVDAAAPLLLAEAEDREAANAVLGWRDAGPFHVVLHARPGEGDGVRSRWEAAGAKLTSWGR